MFEKLRLNRHIQQVKDKDSRVRVGAAEAPGEQSERPAVEPLIQELGQEDSPVRDPAAEALGDPRAVQPLIRALGDADPDARRAAAEALAELGEPTWREVVKGDREDFSRLGACGDPRAIEPLLRALGNGSEVVGRAAACALSRLADPPTIERLIRDGDYKVGCGAAWKLRTLFPVDLLWVLGHADHQARLNAASTLGGLDDAHAVEPFIRALGDASEEVRRATAQALGILGDFRAVKPLLRAAGDMFREVRQAAARALTEVYDPRAVQPLIHALAASDHHVRRAAAEAVAGLGQPEWQAVVQGDGGDFARLGACGDPRAVEPLMRALADESQKVRRAAAEALTGLGQPEWQAVVKGDDGDFARLGGCGDRRAVEPLIQALGEAGWSIRQAAAEALGELGDPRGVEPLIQALGDGIEDVRRAAAKALAELGETVWHRVVTGDWEDFKRLGTCDDPRAVELLIRALGDPNSRSRNHVADALGGMGDRRAVEPLLQALGDPEVGVRWAAARALGYLGDPRAVEPLIQALGDKDGGVRLFATRALGELGDARAIEPLIQELPRQHPELRCATAEALARLGEGMWRQIVKGDDNDITRLRACGDRRLRLARVLY